MPRDHLKGVQDEYDVVVIGSGLAGMTSANILGRAGHRVLLLEQHYKLGGLATWFLRPGSHTFDISLHGFPHGMIKSCRRYWNRDISDRIVQLKNIRFDNPQFSLTTTFDREDFSRLLVERFGQEPATVKEFFDTARGMNFYDDQNTTTGQLFERFFPGRNDIVRLLMEPITYANGSTLEDPAITYGIVFSNFMSKGVFIYEGGTDDLVKRMKQELESNNVDIRINCGVDKIDLAGGRVSAVHVGGRKIRCRAIVSNANLKTTILKMIGEDKLDRDYVDQANAVRLNNSSTQVYMALKEGEEIDESSGDLFFTSTAKDFNTASLLSRDITSRTFSFYYPRTRPWKKKERYAIVSSTNANWSDWSELGEEEYQQSKQDLVETTIDALERYIPGVRDKIAHAEAATPRTFHHYTRHEMGASFGTKFEGLQVSRELPNQVGGMFHAGSVGIIMSGWLGAINYGVIVSNEVDQLLTSEASPV
ncbi:phytoene desaturase family protein [Rhodopirellula sp. MGV]|uniref:phytoene desaturase family protein n=1 Tax=Rhodopirellula sp. MGV TaxID=2023130 RepID=UPI000B974D58|nr:FAD-dependent oxidoreductase [Rhodopirellula sp. MGV]OYP29437.1 phytoene dehydrogenase [Rhodopirellula sp. MGV]PNY35743.1 NAD(P)/FAD-dependent oxidoreductase [Rhodopirellula baltica]